MKPCHENNLFRKGRDRTQSFVLTSILQLNILTGAFLLVSWSNTFQNLLWSVPVVRSRPKMLTKTYNKEVCQAS